MKNLTKLYRAEPYYSNKSVSVFYEEYKILRFTPKGVWIQIDYDKDKFVLLSGNKRFAYPTKKEALYSLYRRKKRQIQFLEKDLEVARIITHAYENNEIKEYSHFDIQPKEIEYDILSL